ncbi:hypothetical protein [Nocardia sp. NRRL S-836]|uniref:hypothetical protein n=1 Tax=Nocardia sp. NRRL S-836 TaxID=1519492 RepID=UPI0006AF8DEC|nr:hypothetical protein [Nocardia sp. NRRL S-836]KOV85338.1 hypothetical protein ADL03_14470 [Nocardia sp. NRRL S-836]
MSAWSGDRAVSTHASPSPAQVRDALLAHLQRHILHDAAGEHIKAGKRLPDREQAKLWLGQLASEQQLAADRNRGMGGDRMVPAAEGFSFLVRGSSPVNLDIELSFAVYLPLHPTVEEQQAFVNAAPGDASAAARRTNGQGHHLAGIWRKVPVGPLRLHTSIAEGATSHRFGADKITAAISEATRSATGTDLYRPRLNNGMLPRDIDFADARAWTIYVAHNLLPASETVLPRLSAALDVDITPTDHGRDLMITVVNTSPTDEAQFADKACQVLFDRNHLDTKIYEVKFAVTTPAPLDVYTLEQVVRSHRYDRTVEAFGQACPVEVDFDAKTGLTTLRTGYGAVSTTGRVHPGAAGVDTSFSAFIDEPVSAATAMVDLHAAWVNAHWSTKALNERQAERMWSEEARAAADSDAAAARREVHWLQTGLAALTRDPELQRAFVLMNRSMQRLAENNKKFTSWFPFQIAWIIGCLPSVADPDLNDDVQILAVPPGGGKTEGFTAVALVHLFYARLRGDLDGVTVWARFPLRLLAAQQTERFAAAVFAAELVRRGEDDLRRGTPFGIGYFVGSATTPNRYWPPRTPWAQGVNPTDPSEAARCRVLDHCPVCDPAGVGEKLEVAFDETRWVMQHRCINRGCAMYGPLPLWVVDDDIYRHTPSVLVGTVDKLAQVAHNTAFKVIFGQAAARCTLHGWTVDPSRCSVYGCGQATVPVRKGLGHLRCEITDELHLLDESLGALDGMYETVVQQIGKELGNRRLHILAATGTIEGYENQVHHLYQREARRFPEPGPDSETSFFSHVVHDDPLRRYIGVYPRGTTMVTAGADVTRIHNEWLIDALKDPGDTAAKAGLPSDDQQVVDVVAQALAHDYEVLLGYCLRNEDMAAYINDDRVGDLLVSAESQAVISGSQDIVAIREAVSRLNNPPQDPARRTRLVVATKAIGHGFDSHRLGIMVLMGTPTQAAEIIQATARVGRAHPGLVVHMFNPSRDRDTSVFRWYAKWISYLDRLVSKVPVNRESLPVLQRALPAALMAQLLQVYDRTWTTSAKGRSSLGNADQFRDAVACGFIRPDKLITDLNTGLGLDASNPYHDRHREAVREFVDNTLIRLPVGTGANRRTADLLRPPVPRSLRDIEAPIAIIGYV